MKNYCPLVFSIIFLAGCGSISSSKGEKHQMELSVHKVRTEVEDIKHELNTYEIEHHVIEGKLMDQDQLIASLREQIVELKSKKADSFVQQMQNLEKKLHQVSKKQEKIVTDIRNLASHANETTTALSQYKDKIAHFEKTIQEQEIQLHNILETKEKNTSYTKPENSKTYRVKMGDSLEKIARNHHTTTDKLKQLNHIKSDLIVIDQLIILP